MELFYDLNELKKEDFLCSLKLSWYDRDYVFKWDAVHHSSEIVLDWTGKNVQCTLQCLQCKVYSVQCTMHSVQYSDLKLYTTVGRWDRVFHVVYFVKLPMLLQSAKQPCYCDIFILSHYLICMLEQLKFANRNKPKFTSRPVFPISLNPSRSSKKRWW